MMMSSKSFVSIEPFLLWFHVAWPLVSAPDCSGAARSQSLSVKTNGPAEMAHS